MFRRIKSCGGCTTENRGSPGWPVPQLTTIRPSSRSQLGLAIRRMPRSPGTHQTNLPQSRSTIPALFNSQPLWSGRQSISSEAKAIDASRLISWQASCLPSVIDQLTIAKTSSLRLDSSRDTRNKATNSCPSLENFVCSKRVFVA